MKVLKYALPALAIAGSTSFIAPVAQAAEDQRKRSACNGLSIPRYFPV